MKKIFYLLFLFSICAIKMNAQDYAVRVNLPSFAIGNFNADLSFKVSDNFSLHIQGETKPFDYKIPVPLKMVHLSNKYTGWSKLFYFTMLDHSINYTLQPGIKYWLNGVYNRGFFFGANAIGTIYKVGGDKIDRTFRKGYAFGGALSAGYSYELSELFNIEFEFGLGAYYSRYHNLLSETNETGYFNGKLSDVKLFPNRLSISLVYLF